MHTPPLASTSLLSDPTKLKLLQMMEEVEDYAIILLDNKGYIQSWNKGAERIKGYSAQEIIGKNFRVFYSETDLLLDTPSQLLLEAASKGSVQREGWRVKKDKTTFWASISIKALYNEKAEVIGFAKITRDLTDRQLAEKIILQHAQQIERKNKELEQFVYIASHDLQEPLLNLTNFVELLQYEYGSLFDETANMYFDVISQGASRMRNLIRCLLDYSRLGQQAKLVRVDCQQLVETVISDLSVPIKASGAEIHFENLPILVGYATELHQLFQNLLSNAIKFRKPGVSPDIRITAEQTAEGCRFAVSDNGIGIAPEFKEKIFLIFQRLHEREVYEGNGIGLAHCKKIVEMHGGTIQVESVTNQGSTFWVTLPFLSL
ncbi:ATP-binding protein [Siphonobacter sp. SORGH_AS_1065]|uniref:sensor histidine kinase n=1 Tax=Siphonobacter sp. SORGH_AS_1065 TaxID=3041795 RepID=UPI00278711D7|nr:ATP-binding protein [Siphonobacter sp. SORGH_AS_1065]MDQ1086625.1 PAS domain S-box-containing protein [Siphonobacter sp. SORGH_AS_1065]